MRHRLRNSPGAARPQEASGKQGTALCAFPRPLSLRQPPTEVKARQRTLRQAPARIRFRNSLLDMAACSLAAALGFLPWRACSWSGKILGRLAALVLCRKTRRVLENLNRMGSTDPALACREACVHAATTVLEVLALTSRMPGHIHSRLKISGLECLRRAAQSGRGVLLVSAHIANWELVACAAAQAGMRVGVVAKPLRVPRLQRRLIAFRQRWGILTLLRGEPGTASVPMRWLRQGGILGCMMDRASTGKRAMYPFLGGAICVSLGPAILARRVGAAIVFGHASRREDGATEVTFTEISKAAEGSVPEITLRIVRALEAEIRSRPEQWFWIYRRNAGGSLQRTASLAEPKAPSGTDRLTQILRPHECLSGPPQSNRSEPAEGA